LSVSQGLCESCGLCCDGTLFSWVRLEPSELAWAQALRLPMIDKSGTPAFLQPCACFDGARCLAYAERPTRCRNYECKLLKSVDAGETTLEDAFAKVRKAKDLARATFPKGRSQGAPPGLADDPLWHAQAGDLEARLDRDFQERD
jgi:uncharacterized protein